MEDKMGDLEKGGLTSLTTHFNPTSGATTQVGTPQPSSPKLESLSPTGLEAEADIDIANGNSPSPPVINAAAASKPDPNIVEWDGPDDPENPQNWPFAKKMRVTAATALMTFCVSFASSVFSTASEATASHFHKKLEVMILGVSLYVLGFSFGPLAWGPLSELYGRRNPLMIGYFIFAIMNIPVAVATNVETIFLSRFLAGTFGAAPLAIVGGMYVDFWSMADRGVAVCGYCGAVFLGPIVGPIAGEYITRSYLGWRWTAWVTFIVSIVSFFIGFVCVPETFAPVLLQRRATKLRHDTQNWALHSKLDETPVHWKSMFQKYFFKPIVMLVEEPILASLTVYLSLVYGILYLIFFAYPFSFEEVRQWKEGTAALPFIAVFIGIALACLGMGIDTKTRFQRLLAASGGGIIPEARLPPMIVGAFLLPIGLFWFAWTSNRNIHWAPQVVSGVFIGAGILAIFLPGLNYIVDCYLLNANSALAANTFARSLFAAAFPLFATYMYQNLGVAWATSLLGFLSLAMIPFPIGFYIYGKKFRSRGKYTFDLGS